MGLLCRSLPARGTCSAAAELGVGKGFGLLRQPNVQRDVRVGLRATTSSPASLWLHAHAPSAACRPSLATQLAAPPDPHAAASARWCRPAAHTLQPALRGESSFRALQTNRRTNRPCPPPTHTPTPTPAAGSTAAAQQARADSNVQAAGAGGHPGVGGGHAGPL